MQNQLHNNTRKKTICDKFDHNYRLYYNCKVIHYFYDLLKNKISTK